MASRDGQAAPGHDRKAFLSEGALSVGQSHSFPWDKFLSLVGKMFQISPVLSATQGDGR
jgi:hypothetical protein